MSSSPDSTPLDPAVIESQLIADLERLVAIPSIGALEQHQGDLATSAEVVAQMLRDLGCPEVNVIEDEAAPAVVGRYPAPAGAPTICLYAHHDVQPIGDRSLWKTDPLVATRSGDRLFGRGVADDKGGIAVHFAALRALADEDLPVGVTVFIEGEEEMGSPHVREFIRDHADLLAADAYLVADSGNWGVDEPAFTTTLRGVCDVTVEVATLDHAVHSGQFGGPVPDALTALCRLLATLHHEDGSVAVAGLRTSVSYDVDYSSEQLRADAGMLDGVQELGSGSLAERLWSGPSATVIGLDAPSVEESSNTLIPSARARISLRVPPGMEADEALDHLIAHCQNNAPWGSHVTVTPGGSGNPGQLPVTGPFAQAAKAAYHEAFGADPVLMGQGGAIPITGELLSAFPHSEVIANAVCDPDSRMHAPNESAHVGLLVRTVAAEVAFLRRAATAVSQSVN
ncbi:MAG: dipeptidase [Propionibacteriaceae bacterium]|jgi:acetylornithine deacetylase/succinyl-diaminopimelate desuccinylase-like protein|nr:dipeptidase [Propionibacteriaceae bacterium]